MAEARSAGARPSRSLRSVRALHAAAWAATAVAAEERVKRAVLRASVRRPGVEVKFYNGVGWGWYGRIGGEDWTPRVGATLDALAEDLGCRTSFPANFGFTALDGRIVHHLPSAG